MSILILSKTISNERERTNMSTNKVFVEKHLSVDEILDLVNNNTLRYGARLVSTRRQSNVLRHLKVQVDQMVLCDSKEQKTDEPDTV